MKLFYCLFLATLLSGTLCFELNFDQLKEVFDLAKDKFYEALEHFPAISKRFGETIDAVLEEECIFKCPNGKKPRRKLYHQPQPNGCGVPGLQIPNYIPIKKLEICCNEHDICYGICNRDKEKCDKAFKHCLYSICTSIKALVPENLYKGCKGVAKTMYTAVTAMGCIYYLDSQKEACICDYDYYDYQRDEL